MNIKNPLFIANGVFFVLGSVEEDSAEKLIDGADGEQSLNSWLSEAQQQKLTFGKGAKNVVRSERIVRSW